MNDSVFLLGLLINTGMYLYQLTERWADMLALQRVLSRAMECIPQTDTMRLILTSPGVIAYNHLFICVSVTLGLNTLSIMS